MMTELIDVKDLALELEVSRQTIYNHIQKNKQLLVGHTKKIDRITYLDSNGVRIIKESMGLIEVPTINEQIGIEDIVSEIAEKVSASTREDIAGIITQLENKEKQRQAELEDKDKQIQAELEDMKKQNQVLMDKLDSVITKQNEKKSLWQRILGK